jgi:PAS domain S-box-containing protein
MPKKNQRLVYLSVITLASAGLIGYSDYKSNQKLVDSEHWVQHTEQVIYESGNIFSVAKDIELASQGCVISHDSVFLRTNVTPQEIFTSIGLLKQLTLDNPTQQARIDSLTLYMKRYLFFSFQTADIRSKKGFAAAVAFIAMNGGKYYADRIVQITTSIQQEENRLLKQRMQTNERSVAVFKSFSVFMLIIIGLFAALLLITSSKYFLQNKEKVKRAAELVMANKELAFQNEEKEKRAQELIIANQELVIQNSEKEKRAAELIIANDELRFQNQLKEKAGLERAQSEKRHARIQQVAHMGSWQLSLANNIVIYSDEACSIYGIPPEQSRMTFDSWISFIHPEDVNFVLEKIDASRNSLQDFSFYYRIIHKKESVRHIYLESKLEFDLDLKATGFYGIMHDVSEIKLAEEKIDFDRNNLAALINNTDDMMWSIDMDLQLITFNEAFNKLIILTTGKPLRKGENILLFHTNENRLNTFKILYEKALKGDTFTILDRLDYPAELWSEVSFYPLRNGNTIIGTACFSRDVTQRTKNEGALRAMEQQILNQKVQEQKKITRAILNAQETERNHIGQELHDNISQILASSKLFLSSAGHRNEVLKDLVKYPIELIDSSIHEIRLLSSKHVTPLKNVDLRELVQSLLDGLRANTLIDTAFKYDVDNRELNDDLKLNIYRIIQEQINNIVKHASPGKVDISVQAEDNALHIEMKDDGKGFDVKKKRSGIGLSNMMNRIESFNGQMVIESSLGKGCSVQIDIPY